MLFSCSACKQQACLPFHSAQHSDTHSVHCSQAVYVARLSGADLAPARQLLERLWGPAALAAPVLAEQTQLKVVYAVHAHGRSSTEPVERDLHLPEQLQAAVGAAITLLSLV